MGTSLSGLTPATTFDGLLKTSDNDALDATLKTIGTGDGTDSVLQLSNSALQVNGPTTINGAQMTIVGATNDNTTNALVVQNSDGIELLKVRNERYAQLGTSTIGIQTVISSNANWIKGNANYLQDTSSNYYGNIGSSGIQIGNGSAAATARLQVKGSGATSATTSLLVQNSAGSDLLKVTDDGAIDFGVLGLDFSNDGSGGTMSVASDRYIKLASSLSTYSALSAHLFKTFDGSAYSEIMRITGNTNQRVGIGETTPTARLHVKGSGNTNTTTSLLVQNSDGTQLFKITDNRDVYLGSSSNYIHQGIFFQGNYNAPGDWNFGTASDLGAKLGIKGSGATSATTALLVQNSAGTDMMTMRDDGVFILGPAGNRKFFEGTVVNSKFRVIDNSSLHTVHADGSTNPRVFLRSGPNNSEPNSHYVANYINGTYIGKDVVTPTSTLHIKGSGNDATTTALLVQNSDGDELFKVDDSGATDITANITNAVLGSFRNTDANGFGIELRAGNATSKYSMQWERYSGGGGGRLYPDGVMIGDQVAPTARLQVKGSGATSATTALLVENSAGTDLLKVEDGGNIRLGGNMYASQYIFNKTATSTWIQFVPSAHQIELTANTNKMVVVKSNGVGINTGSADASAVLQADSTTQGFLPPRMTTTQRDAITTPAAGLMIYNTDTNTAECWNGSAWMPMF